MGVDGYQRWTALPMTIGLFNHLYNGKYSRVSLIGILGYSFCWSKKNEMNSVSPESGRGMVAEPAISCRIGSGKWKGPILVGYKWQFIHYSYPSGNFYYSNATYEVDELAQRIVLQVGIGIN